MMSPCSSSLNQESELKSTQSFMDNEEDDRNDEEIMNKDSNVMVGK